MAGTTANPIKNVTKVKLVRKKRFLALVGGLVGLGGLGLSTYNTWQLHNLKGIQRKMEFELCQTRRTVNFLHKGIEALNSKIDAIQHLVHEEVEYIWENLEYLRCNVQKQMDEAIERITLARCEQYLQHRVSAALHGAMEGKLTPQLVGSKSLGRLLFGSGYPNTSMVWREQALAYKYGKLYPILVDMNSMTFGYVLEVSLINKENVFPLFRIFKVGFHRGPKDPNLYKSPLPDYFVIHSQTGFYL